MAKPTLGKLPPRYKLIINQYSDVRLSRCPVCRKLTHSRKFALFIHIDDWGPITLGKTCRYCTPCELVMIHKDELERELAGSFQRLAPAAIGSRVTIKTGERLQMQEVTSQTSYYSHNDFRLHFGLGANKQADSIEIRWANGETETVKNIGANQFISIKEGDSSKK